MGWCGGGRDDPVVVYRRYAWNRGLPFGSGAVCGGRGQLAESVFPLSLIQAAGRPFHSREGPPFGLTGLSETSNVTRLVEERTFRARVLTSPNDPNRHCPRRALWTPAQCKRKPIHGTTLRYRCQVACPSTGMTMMRPRNAGIDPITRPAATIRPQSAIGPGFAATARIDVHTAASRPTSRSSKSGNDTTLIASTSKAKRNPTPTPTRIIVQPALVVNTSWTNAAIETGGSGPRVSWYISLAASSQSRKIASSTNPSIRIAPNPGEPITSNA